MAALRPSLFCLPSRSPKIPPSGLKKSYKEQHMNNLEGVEFFVSGKTLLPFSLACFVWASRNGRSSRSVEFIAGQVVGVLHSRPR